MKKLWVLVFIWALVSCGKIPETRYFTLDYQLDTQSSEQNNGILYVKNFKTDPIYNNDKLVYKVSNYEVKFDNYRRWVLAPGDLLTIQTIEHLRNTGPFAWVTNARPRQDQYWLLDGHVIHFEEMQENNQRYVHVDIAFLLYNNTATEPLLNKRIGKRIEITQAGAEGIVSAMSQATQLVLDELASQLLNLDSIKQD